MLFRIFIKLFPWILIFVCLYFLISQRALFDREEEAEEVIVHNVILEKIESLGKLELVKYSFQEITELKEKNNAYLGLFPAGDSKVVLISHGEAVGCLDLEKIKRENIQISEDSLIIELPAPELCYYKLDLARTRIYSIEKGVYYKDEQLLLEKVYRLAENQIKESALSSGILQDASKNAELILRPFLEEVSSKSVHFSHDLTENVQAR